MDIEGILAICGFFLTVIVIARGIFASGRAKLEIQRKQLEIREQEVALEREKIRFIATEDERLAREAAIPTQASENGPTRGSSWK